MRCAAVGVSWVATCLAFNVHFFLFSVLFSYASVNQVRWSTLVRVSVCRPMSLVVALVGAAVGNVASHVQHLHRRSFSARPSLSVRHTLVRARFCGRGRKGCPVPVLETLGFLRVYGRGAVCVNRSRLVMNRHKPHPGTMSAFPRLAYRDIRSLRMLGAHRLRHCAVDRRSVSACRHRMVPC